MILVTGATGILGRVIVLELLRRGKTVRATKRPGSNRNDVLHSYHHYTPEAEALFKRIEWIDTDFTYSSLNAALQGVTEIYHCAAKVSFAPKDKKELYRTNIDGTRELFFACENSSVQKFCFVSSIAVFDGVNEHGQVDETCDFNSKLDHSDYAISKHFSEMEAWRASAEGMNVVIINPGMIIGSGNWQQSSGELFATFEKNNFTFSGGSAYVDVRDVANCAIELMEQNVFGERFILVSENRRYADIGKIIRNRLGLKELSIVKASQLKIARVLNLLFGWLFPRLRLATRSNIEAVTSFAEISSEKIKSRLGYRFIPVDESLAFHLENYVKDKTQIIP